MLPCPWLIICIRVSPPVAEALMLYQAYTNLTFAGLDCFPAGCRHLHRLMQMPTDLVSTDMYCSHPYWLSQARAKALEEPLGVILSHQEATWGPLAWKGDQQDQKSNPKNEKSEGQAPGFTREEDFKAQGFLGARMNVSVAIASIGRPDLLDLMRQALGQRHAAVKVKGKN
jgi:hypothetical protein